MSSAYLPPQIRVGYGKDLGAYNKQLPFVVKFPKLRRRPTDPFNEAQIAALEIGEHLGANFVLCLSGGLDSEAMAHAFLAAKVPFEVATLRFKNDLNLNEIKYALSFCKEHNLKHHLIDLDIVDFFENKKFTPYYDLFTCHNLEQTAQLWFLDQINMPFVWGAEAFRVFKNGDELKIQAISEFEATVNRYVEIRQRLAIPNFHFYSSELAWSFFIKSLSYDSKFYEDDHCLEYYQEKLKFYAHCGFKINSARKQKLHGFEDVKIFFDTKYKDTDKESYRKQFRGEYIDKNKIVNQAILDIAKDDLIVKEILDL